VPGAPNQIANIFLVGYPVLDQRDTIALQYAFRLPASLSVSPKVNALSPRAAFAATQLQATLFARASE
jgi:hypothetical protein